MSVYTLLNIEELDKLLHYYDIGNFVSIEGINEGITNSNFYLTTSKDKYILTIFEQPNLNLNYAFQLMDELSKNKIPCPIPIKTKKNEHIYNYKNKNLSIFTLLPGKTIKNITPSENMCKQIGEEIAKIHLLTKNFKKYNLGLRNIDWFKNIEKKLKPILESEEINIIKSEIKNAINCCNSNLPKGIIHSDLFRDNTMFEDEKLTGIIDFYYACNSYYLYDLAIIVNDWCLKNNMQIDLNKQNLLIESYNKIRKIENLEKKMWKKVLRHAALRFWLSRLHDKYFPTNGAITHQLDPNEFKLILLDRMNNSYSINI